ncbi:MAG: ABC-type multidrug transport system ATPase subunit, partial [Verrucomicrobiales bacterium]
RLILIKNTGDAPIIVRGHQIKPGDFARIFPGHRVVIAEQVITHQDFVFYFNAKKDVSSTQLYLAFGWDGGVFVERTKSKESHLEIKFGLGATILALRETHCQLHGEFLKIGEPVSAALHDKIKLGDESTIQLADLRRRARDMGGRFKLRASKAKYLVSNNPDLLKKGDILLSPGAAGEVLLSINCDFRQKTGLLEVLQSAEPIAIGAQVVRSSATLADGDTIKIGKAQFLACHFGDRIIEEQRNLISHLNVNDLSFGYDRKELALENITLSAQRGEMICIIGPSGCGKSTLLRTLAGHQRPDHGSVSVNGHSLYEHLDNLRPYISYIPHEDAFDPHLTVQENIDYAAAIRCPHLSYDERKKRVDIRLDELGLSERRHRRAGTDQDKSLSGGERKRLNAGLDMTSIADVFLFDEPTSGLSSKDSEHVIEIIRSLSLNKISFVSIHQPSSRLFQLFHKALLLDRGGKLVFFGTPAEMIEYFRRAESEEMPGTVPDPQTRDQGENLQPDFIFDVLETPLRDLSGDIIFEEDDSGHYSPARRFSPEYWRDRYQAHRLLEEVRSPKFKPEASSEAAAALPEMPQKGLEEQLVHLGTHIKRSFLSKLRNRANLITTLLEAPALAILVASVLRFSEEASYTFASAFHVPTYIFLSLVIALFLGLTNSADEVIRDRALLARERGHGIRVWHYVTGKAISLGFFALVQCVIYLLIGNAILTIRDMFFTYLFWMFLTSMNGVVAGLFISSIVKDSKTAQNIIPLILIPQIILGGALIRYEEMNRNLDLVHQLERLFASKDKLEEFEEPNELKVPPMCEFMPLRWSYEALVIAQDTKNPLANRDRELLNERDNLVAYGENLSKPQLDRLETVKSSIAILYGMEATSYKDLRRLVDRLDETIAGGDLDHSDFDIERDPDNVRIVDVYQNEKILDLVFKAESERQADLSDEEPDDFPNVFFGVKKRYWGGVWDTINANAIMLVMFSFLGLGMVWVSVKIRVRKV